MSKSLAIDRYISRKKKGLRSSLARVTKHGISALPLLQHSITMLYRSIENGPDETTLSENSTVEYKPSMVDVPETCDSTHPVSGHGERSLPSDVLDSESPYERHGDYIDESVGPWSDDGPAENTISNSSNRRYCEVEHMHGPAVSNPSVSDVDHWNMASGSISSPPFVDVTQRRHFSDKGMMRALLFPFRRVSALGLTGRAAKTTTDTTATLSSHAHNRETAISLVVAGLRESVSFLTSSPQAAVLFTALLAAHVARIGVSYQIFVRSLRWLAETPLSLGQEGSDRSALIRNYLLENIYSHVHSFLSKDLSWGRLRDVALAKVSSLLYLLRMLRARDGWASLLAGTHRELVSVMAVWSSLWRQLGRYPELAPLVLLLAGWSALRFAIIPQLAVAIENHRLRVLIRMRRGAAYHAGGGDDDYSNESTGGVSADPSRIDAVQYNRADSHFLVLFWSVVSHVTSAAFGAHLLAAILGPSLAPIVTIVIMLLEGMVRVPRSGEVIADAVAE